MKQRIAQIYIQHEPGHVEKFQAIIIAENSLGFICAVNPNQPNATEWFAFNSPRVQAIEV